MARGPRAPDRFAADRADTQRCTWSWGRYVVVHPARNLDFAEAGARYRYLLVDPSTFSPVTVEELLDAEVFPAQAAAALRERNILA